jgi:hypothetical protein
VTTTATLGTGVLRIEPGSAASVVLTLANDSDIVESYTFGVVGSANGWTTFAPEQVSVFPGKSEKVTVTFAPPRAPTTAAGEVAFGIRVIPSERPDNATVPEGTLTVLPFFDTTAELLPRMSHGRRSIRPQVAVDNRGNVPLRVSLESKDPSDQVLLTPLEPELTIEPGAAAFAFVRVRARKSIIRGQNTAHPFLITVTPDGQRPIPLDGTFLQVPILPAWALKALLAALAVLVALAILWFTVLKPALDSAATSAKAAQQSAVAAYHAASKATGTTIKPPKSVTPSKPTSTKSSTYFSLASSSGSSKWGAPNNATLNITDLVFSNPQGDYGLLTLSDGTTLFQMELSNFRNDDYHFLTPLTVTPNQQLTLTIRCDSPGTDENAAGTANAATNCNDAVLVSGTLITPAS